MKLLLSLSFVLGFATILIGMENNQSGPIWLGMMFIMFGICTSAFAVIENALFPAPSSTSTDEFID